MPNDGLRVNHQALLDSADAMDRIFARIQNNLTDLDQALQPLKADWTGSQQVAYQEVKKVWDREMSDMADILTRTSGVVRDAQGFYDGADKAGAKLFNGGA